MSLARVLTLAAFGAVLLMIVGVEVAARRTRSGIPSLGEVCGFVMRYRAGGLPVGRIAVLGFWWWVGWHFIAR
jgi:hypothetical protein